MEPDKSPSLTFPAGRILKILLPVAFINLTACSTAPDPERAEIISPAPEAWRNGHSDTPLNAADLATWWQQFEDPVLQQLLMEAFSRNIDTRLAASRISQARAEMGIEESARWPSISAGLNGSYSEVRDRDTDTTADAEAYGLGLNASWEIDLFGRQAAALDAAEADWQMTIEDYYAVQVAISAEVASTYFQLIAYEAQLEILRQNLETREETLDIIRWQEQAGESDALETEQARTSVEQTRAQIPQVQQGIEEARNALAILCGRNPVDAGFSWQASAELPEPPPTPATGVPADILNQRPDLRSAENNIQAATARLTAAQRDRLPSISLSGYLGTEAIAAGELLDFSTIISNVAGSLTAPLFTAGRISRTIESRNEQVLQAYLAYEAAALTAFSEVENTLSSLDALTRRLDSLKMAVESARSSADLAQMQYEAGEIDLLNVLDAQRTLLSVEQDAISTEADRLIAHVLLYKALGGGWSPLETISRS